MTRRPKTTKTARIHIRCTEEEAALIDAARGNWSASTFIREAVQLAIAAGCVGPNSILTDDR